MDHGVLKVINLMGQGADGVAGLIGGALALGDDLLPGTVDATVAELQGGLPRRQAAERDLSGMNGGGVVLGPGPVVQGMDAHRDAPGGRREDHPWEGDPGQQPGDEVEDPQPTHHADVGVPMASKTASPPVAVRQRALLITFWGGLPPHEGLDAVPHHLREVPGVVALDLHAPRTV